MNGPIEASIAKSPLTAMLSFFCNVERDENYFKEYTKTKLILCFKELIEKEANIKRKGDMVKEILYFAEQYIFDVEERSLFLVSLLYSFPVLPFDCIPVLDSLNKIDRLALLATHEYKKMFCHPSAMHWLVKNGSSQRLFEILEVNSAFQSQILEGEEFIHGLCASADVDENMPALYWIVMDAKSIKEFFKMLKKSVLFTSKLCNSHWFIQALCALRPSSAGEDENTSALYWLAGNNDYRNLFFYMLEKYPLFQEKLFHLFHIDQFLEALCALRSSATGGDKNTSPLYWIVGNPESRKLFFEMLEKHPLFQEKLFHSNKFLEALCALRPSAAGFYGNTSALYFIVANTDSRKPFFEMVEKYPLFREKLFHNDKFLETLCTLRPSAVGGDTNTSAL